ncbi:MAG: phage tail tape measure protein, partial [Lentisphaeria bacterium]|nr:phage tail tape measure protein [Lentisphaeria bacterium]
MSIGRSIRAGAAYVEVTAETSKLHRNLTAAQAQLQAFGKTCTAVGKDLLMLSGAMALPLVMAAKSFAGFDDSMRLVQAVTQATDNDFKALTATSQRLGRETSYTAQQVADAMVALGRMGFAPAEIQAAIADVLNLARATGTDLSEAGDIAANSLRIFGLEAGKMSDIADVLTVTANSSAQTLIDLFEALKMGGPQAAAAGESVRETCAALAVLANMGIKGSLAGTALRKSFSQFAKVKVQEQLRAVGVETLDANGNLRKMAEIMRDIAKVMQTMPTAEKLAFAEDIFDIRGSLAGLTLTANTDELDAMLAKLLDVEGVAADTAQKMDAGLGGSFRLLMSAVEGAMNAIAAAMNSTLQPFIKKVTDVINVFTQWIEQHQGLVTAFALVVAGAATLGIALVAIGVIAKGVSAGITVMQTVMKGFAFVQGMCIAQATALKSSFLLIGQAFVDYRNMAIPAMVGTEKFCAALGLASTAANRARASIILMSNAEAAAAVKSAIAEKWRAMTSALSAFRNSAIAATIATKAQAAAEIALGAKTAVVNGWLAMTSALRGMTLASIGATIALKAQAAVEMAMGAKTALLNGWLAMTNALKGLTLASIGSAIALKAQSAAELAMSANTAIVNGWVAMTTALRGLTLASISAAVALKAQAVAERAMTAGRAIAAAWTAMTTALSGLTIATIGATIATKAQAAAEVICTTSTSALNAVRSAGIAIVAAFTAANIKATIAVGAVAAGNFLLAAAAKVAAVAMMALSAVMSFVAAHPVAIALIALTAILAGVCIALYRAASYTAKLSDEATKLREKGDQLRRTDEARMERLQQLAQKQRLTNAEMA